MRVAVVTGAIAAAIAIGAAAGNGTAPVATVTPASLSFGSQNIASGPTAPQAATVGNAAGTGTLSMASVAITGTDAGDFTLTNPCGNAIGAGSSCAMSVRFDPITAGVKAATLTVTDNASGSPHTSTLSGTGTSSGGGGNANLFVDTNGGSCTRSASLIAYVDATACASFQAAYTAASCGDLVGVQPGTYASQSVSSNIKSCTSTTPVVITSSPGAACTDNTVVAMPQTNISVAYLTEACMNANSTGPLTDNCSDISASNHATVQWNAFDHMALECSFFDSDHLRVTNSTYGPVNVCDVGLEDMVVFRANATAILDNIFDNVTFGAVSAPPDFQCGLGQHVDSMQGYGIQITIRNSTFTGCPGQCIIFRPLSGGIPGPILFENNVFNQPGDPGQAIDLGDSATSGVDTATGPIVVQNNTFVNGASIHGGFNNVAPTIRNNVFTNSSCNFGSAGSNQAASYTNNVFTAGTACGSVTKSCTPSWVAPNASVIVLGDYHLNGSDTCARNASNQTVGNYPATDFDGDTRPLGPAVDSGMDEIP